MSNIPVVHTKDVPGTLPIFQELSRRMDEVQHRAFEMFSERGHEPGHDLDDWLAAEHEILGWPAAELTEQDGEYEMDLTLPGFAPADIEVTATPDEVVVHAMTESTEKGRSEKVVWSEFGRNDVYRRVRFPTEVDPEAVTADFSNGLLRVHAPIADAKSAPQPDGPAGA